jgi:hypothetical protein
MPLDSLINVDVGSGDPAVASPYWAPDWGPAANPHSASAHCVPTALWTAPRQRPSIFRIADATCGFQLPVTWPRAASSALILRYDCPLAASGVSTWDAHRILWLLESNLQRLEEHRDRLQTNIDASQTK